MLVKARPEVFEIVLHPFACRAEEGRAGAVEEVHVTVLRGPRLRITATESGFSSPLDPSVEKSWAREDPLQVFLLTMSWLFSNLYPPQFFLKVSDPGGGYPRFFGSPWTWVGPGPGLHKKPTPPPREPFPEAEPR